MDGKRVVAVGLRSAPEYRYEKLSWESHMEEQDKILSELTGSEYKYGFTTDIETEMIPKGLDEEVVRLISAGVDARIPFESFQALEDDDDAALAAPRPAGD